MPATSPSPLRICLGRAFAPALAFALALSVGITVLQLGISLYSLQVFDRVLPSGHLATLLLLSLAIAGSLIVMGTLDGLRAALLQRMGTRLGDQIARKVLVAASATGTSAGAALRELESMRGTLCGPPMQALFELPWLPLAIAAATLLHPWLGALAFAAALLLVLLGWINSRVTRPRLRRGHQLWTEAHDQAEAISRQADTVRAMGLLAALEFCASPRPIREPCWNSRLPAKSAVGWAGSLAPAGSWSRPLPWAWVRRWSSGAS